MNYWKEISFLIGFFASVVALRLNCLKLAKLKKEIEILKKTEATPDTLQIATFEQVEK